VKQNSFQIFPHGHAYRLHDLRFNGNLVADERKTIDASRRSG
jgi:hypothetical protein